MAVQSTKAQVTEWVRSIVIAAVCATLVILFVAQSFVVEGTSMLPNMQDRDRLLIEKISYRFHGPQRGDVIVFRVPGEPTLIKRVIGVPGDTILIKDHRVHINGQPIDESYTNGQMIAYTQIGPITVPEDHYFVMGDNRNVSRDSRDPSLGTIESSDIIGRALLRYWPLNKLGFVKAFRPLEE